MKRRGASDEKLRATNIESRGDEELLASLRDEERTRRVPLQKSLEETFRKDEVVSMSSALKSQVRTENVRWMQCGGDAW